MAVWGEASYKVKRAITFHERFTVADLVDATDLAYSQVEQVVQRLINQGYVHKLETDELSAAERAVAKKVGRPRQRYTLTEDKAKREEFYTSVEAIASAERLSRGNERKPSTPYFARAMQLIEAMERGVEPLSNARLEEAETLLAYGRDFEGLIREGVETVQAYYGRGQARLEAQRGSYSKAEELLVQAEEAFQAAGLHEQAQRTTDLELALKASQILAEIREMIARQIDPLPRLEELERLVHDFPSPSHLLLPLQQAIKAISAALEVAVREMQIAIMSNTIATQQNTQALHRLTQALESSAGKVDIGEELELTEWVRMVLQYPRARVGLLQAGVDAYVTQRGDYALTSLDILAEETGRD